MSQLPQNNEAFGNAPEYAKLYHANNSVQPSADDTDDWEQHASEQPSDVQREQAGEKAASSSLTFGFLGLLSLFLGISCLANGLGAGLVPAFVAPFLSILGIWKAFGAREYGVRATGGLILSLVGIIIALAIIALIMLIVNALSHIH
ncbi:hypothetical protein [Rothia mucilaginosa]|uniref:hypothetical protein n=1 Tax=Rothia mucilaginosa TaxID=43675 RepID=UPI0028E8451F|nr:hypothetical protein [Rothia mucilaginosa]